MINTSLFGPLSQKNRDTFSSVKEQAFDPPSAIEKI
jgi:hypothetical protein